MLKPCIARSRKNWCRLSDPGQNLTGKDLNRDLSIGDVYRLRSRVVPGTKQSRNSLFSAQTEIRRGTEGTKILYQVKEIKSKMIIHNLMTAVQTVVIVVIWEEFNRVCHEPSAHR